MKPFFSLLRQNRNYRFTWMGQLVSEIGDHFNNIAVFSLAVAGTKSGLVVSGVMLARAIPAVLAGPLAGVTLDRLNRKYVMIASDLIRALVAAAFILTLQKLPSGEYVLKGHSTTLLYVLSALLMFASPFFTSGRSSILPSIATSDELHTANTMTQTTQWTTLAVGAFLGGTTAMWIGYKAAFIVNALSFVFSALCISRLFLPGRGFRAERRALTEADVVRPWHEYVEGLRYMRSVPLILGLAGIGIGWATGGGAAQILFTMFGEVVFKRGPWGLGLIWGCAGVGLVCGGALAYAIGRRLTFDQYKWSISLCYVVHGGAYVCFSLVPSFYWALFFIALSRAGVGFSSTVNMSQLLRHVPDQFRGRVFATMESTTWSVMMISMMLAGIASSHWDSRVIGTAAGLLSSTTAIYWAWANMTGRLPEPAAVGIEPEEIEVHGEPTV